MVLSGYLYDLERRIRRAFAVPTEADQDCTTVVLCRILKGGEPINIKLSKSSGNASFDESAIMSFAYAAPFRSLQQPNNFLDVEVTFNPEAVTVRLLKASQERPDNSPAETQDYISRMTRRLSRNWRGTQESGPRSGAETTILNFRILPGGEVVDVEIARSSGNSSVDEFILERMRTQTLAPLPIQGYLWVEGTFGPEGVRLNQVDKREDK